MDKDHAVDPDRRAEIVDQMEAVVAASGGDPEKPRTRRQLLRLAGLAAAGGAGAVIASGSPAAAANGGNFILGASNSATNFSGLNSAAPLASLSVGVDEMGDPTITALSAASETGVDLKLNGTGRLGMAAAFGGNAQPSYLPTLHDLVKSSSGALWSGTGATFSSSRTWKRINAVRVDNPNGNGTAFAPFRLVNTINGTGGASGKRTTNTNTVYDAAGHANLPDDTIAIFGNLSVVDPTYSNGYIKLFPTGVAVPNTSAINFNAGQTVANFFFLGLGTGADAGKFTVRPGSSVGGSGSVHVVVDVTGYVQ